MTKSVRILFVTGSYPPMRCGVGDYSAKLITSLAKFCDITVVTSESAETQAKSLFVRGWQIWRMPALLIRMLRSRPDFVHIQYPTIAFGTSLGPQLLTFMLWACNVRTIVTLHEFRMSNRLRKLACLPLLIFSRLLIFTVQEECDSAARSLPFLYRTILLKSTIIPVGPTIQPEISFPKSCPEKPIIAFFGLFYPGRLIEQCIEAFAIVARRMPNVRFSIIGDRHPRHSLYFKKIITLAESSLPQERLSWVLGKTAEELVDKFSSIDVFLLPYPDGVNFRRTSFLSAQSFGIPTVTTKSDETPPHLINGVNILFASSISEMAESIEKLLSDSELFKNISSNAILNIRNYSWEYISMKHLKVYTLCKKNK